MNSGPKNMDYPAIRAVVKELKPVISGGRLFRSAAVNDTDLMLTFDTHDFGKTFLLISIDPIMSRIHTIPNPLNESKSSKQHLANVLNTRCGGAGLLDIELEPWERVIHLRFITRDIDRSERKDSLIAELMGMHSNLILTDESGIILASQRTVQSHQSSVRQIRAGLQYKSPPPEDKITPREFDYDDFKTLFKGKEDILPEKILVKSLKGISPSWANYIIESAGSERSELKSIHMSYLESLKKIADGIPLDIKPSGDFLPVNTAYSNLYGDLSLRKELGSQKAALTRIIRDLRKSSAKLEERLRKDLDASLNREDLKRKADAILASIHDIPEGASKVELVDVHSMDGAKLTIELDPSRKPSKQAEKLYQRYNKLKRGEDENRKRLNLTVTRLEILDEILEATVAAENFEQLENAASRLEAAGVEVAFDKTGKISQRPSEKTFKVLRFRSSDGFEILAGGNQKANEYLTQRLADGNDIWLHAKEMPGCHVIIRTRRKEVPESTLNEAANIAALYSDGKEGSKVPVDYTKVKHVRKPPGSKPGYVTYKKQRTIRVDPDEARINRLLAD